jgi:hypothetical protein
MANTETLALTPDMLQSLITAAVTAAVAEAQKPAPLTAQEASQQSQEQQQRLEMSDSVKLAKENQRQMQLGCTHEHNKSAGGGTHCVHVREESGHGYILCQYCQGRFRPEIPEAQRLDHGAHYNTSLFNTLFQSCVVTGGEILG